MPISLSRSPKLHHISNRSHYPKRHNHCLWRHHHQQLYSMAVCPLQNGIPFNVLVYLVIHKVLLQQSSYHLPRMTCPSLTMHTRHSSGSSLHGQQLFPVLTLEPSVVQDLIEGGEGQPTLMLLISGLLLKDLRPHISTSIFAETCNSMSLHNGPCTFIVMGPPRALYGLVSNLCKPVFSACFLFMGVPFHSQYLWGAADEVY
jgi:hypothetical protein